MKHIVGFVMLWIMLAVLGGVCEMAQFSVGSGITGTSANTTGHLQTLMMAWDWSEASDPIGYFSVAIGGAATFASTFWDMLWFSYPFFQGEWGLVRWILFIPLSIGLIWVIFNAIRGNSA